MSLTVIIATRGRPEILRETITRLVDNCRLPSTRILVCADDDDEAMKGFKFTGNGHGRVIVSTKPRELTRGMKYDRALTEAPADLYLVAVDHTHINTPGFDEIMVDAAKLFPDGIGCVCSPMANASFPFLQAPTARLCELMGYIQPPQFPFWFIDHWLDDVARMIGRYVMVDIACDSSHRPGKTINLRHLTFWSTYFDALGPDRRAQAERIIAAMDEPTWRKTMLRQSIPMVEYRSQWVNEHVRMNARQMEASRGGEKADPLYLAALKRAVDDMMRITGTEPLEEAA
jgi:hypothetical protein